MTRPVSTRGVGEYQATLAHRAMVNSGYVSASKRGVILLSGIGGTADTWYGTTFDAINTPHAIMDVGFPTASLAVDSTFGNAAMRTRMSNLGFFMQTIVRLPFRFAGAGAGKLHLMGSSMGSICAVNWAAANPTLVASLTLTIGPPDVQAMYASDRAGLQATIGAAFGGGPPPDAENPADLGDDILAAEIPTFIAYSEDDPLCLPAEVEAFGAAAGAEMYSMGEIGHAVDGTEVSRIAQFIQEND